ncbi:MAG: hypothetical protein Q7R95_02305 [bacterium]|nr:hypothetical protein [bacterium]
MIVQKHHNHTNPNFSISILQNTNRIIGSTEDNFGGIRAGTYIKIGTDDNLYSIYNTKKTFYIKEFEIIDSRKILIKENININLQKEDTINILYDEYELNSVLNISQKGKHYNTNDIITIKNGELSIDMLNGIGYPTKLSIEETNEFGEIKRVGLKDKGKYIIAPNNPCEITNEGGMGIGAILELSYKIIDNRSLLKRIIKQIEFQENKTILYLDYSLPQGIKSGKLSAEKWEIILRENYLGANKVNEFYQIYKDFTPYLNIPLMLKNSESAHVIFNQAMLKIEQEIKGIKDKLRI